MSNPKYKWPIDGPAPPELDAARMAYWLDRARLMKDSQQIEDRWEAALAKWYRDQEQQSRLKKYGVINGGRRRLG